MNDSYITPLEKCAESVGSKDSISHESNAEFPLLTSQVMQLHGDICEVFEIGKPILTLISI